MESVESESSLRVLGLGKGLGGALAFGLTLKLAYAGTRVRAVPYSKAHELCTLSKSWALVLL